MVSSFVSNPVYIILFLKLFKAEYPDSWEGWNSSGSLKGLSLPLNSLFDRLSSTEFLIKQ